MWELSQDSVTKEYFVATYYNGVKIKACNNPDEELYCKFEDFEANLLDGFILTDDEVQEFCHGKPPKKESKNDYKAWFYVAIGLIVLVAIEIIAGLVYYFMRKAKSSPTTESESETEVSTKLNSEQEGYFKDTSSPDTNNIDEEALN